jgi:hypothetical protein
VDDSVAEIDCEEFNKEAAQTTPFSAGNFENSLRIGASYKTIGK